MSWFFIGCTSLVARAFREDINPGGNNVRARSGRAWREKMTTLAAILLLACIVYSLLWLALIDARDFVAVFLACSIVIASLCIVPFLMLVTRQAFAAVLFTIFAVFIAKCLGGAIVVSVYGWKADRHVPPYTDLPWEDPNLYVCVFLLITAVLCLWLCVSSYV